MGEDGWRDQTVDPVTVINGSIPHIPETGTTINKPHSSHSPPSFENVLEELGSFGKFQMRQLTVGFLGSFITAYMTMSFVFLGYEPFHTCAPINETNLLSIHDLSNKSSSANITVSYESCDIKVYTTLNQNGSSDSSSEDIIKDMTCSNGRVFPNAEHTTFISEWDLVCESVGQAEVSHLIFTIGQLSGGLIVSAVADVFGRRPILIITSFCAFLTEFGTVFASSIYFIYVIRFFSGLFVQGLSCCFFVHGMEWLVPKHRQVYGVVICIIWVFQLLLVGGAAYLLEGFSWRYFQGVGAISGIMFFIYPLFLYESPRWLAVRYRFTDSLRILKAASDMNGKNFAKVEEVFNSYAAHYRKVNETCLLYDDSDNDTNRLENCDEDGEDDSSAQSSKSRSLDGRKDSLLRLFNHRRVVLMTLTAWYLWITHNMTYYGLYMMSSELVGNRFLNYSLMVLVEIPSNLLIMYVMSKISRRLALRIFLGLAASCLLASTILISVGDSAASHNTLSSVLFIAGKFAISASFNVLYIVTPEIFPTSLRVSGSGSCTSIDKIGSMVAPFLRPLTSVAAWAPGVVFTSMCLVALLLTPLLPETKDTNLPNTLRDNEISQSSTVDREKNLDNGKLELREFGDMERK